MVLLYMLKKDRLIFFIILLLGIIVRVYRLYDFPHGFHVDEAGMFVDASMLARFGVDRYCNSFPVYFTNFGGGQSILYGYFVMLLIKLFGVSFYFIRIPSVFFGILLIVFSFLIGKEVLDKNQSFLLMFLVSICPYFIQSSRIGLDCNLMLCFFVFSLYFFIKAIKSSNNLFYFISGILFGLCFYTYAISYIVVPLFVFSCFVYLFKYKLVSLKNFLLFCLPFLIIVFPLFLFLLVNYGFINDTKFLIFSINKLPIFRSSEISFFNIFNNLFVFVELFSSDGFNYNSFGLFGTFYYVLIPFFFLGFFSVFFKKGFSFNKIIFLMFICGYFALCLIDAPNINKGNYLFFSIIYFIVLGLSKYSFKVIYLVLSCFFVCFVIFYFSYNGFDKFYFSDNIFLVSNMFSDELLDKKIRVSSSNVQPLVYVQMGIVGDIGSPDQINILTFSDNYIYKYSFFEFDCEGGYNKYFFDLTCLH